MLAANDIQPLLEPDILYKPAKIVRKRNLTERIKSRKNGVDKNVITKSGKSDDIFKKTQLQQSIKSYKEYYLNENDNEDKGKVKTNNPLCSPRLEIESETNEAKVGSNAEDGDEGEFCFDSDVNKDYCSEEDDVSENYQKYIEYEDNNDVDGSLISLAQTQVNKNHKKKRKTARLYNCLETCRHKCTSQFSTQERLDICDYYWYLNKKDQVNFIRKHMRRPVLIRIRNKKRGGNRSYFLKYYKIGQTFTTERSLNISSPENDSLTKVCRKFFESTLDISCAEIKEAIVGYELQPETIVRPLGTVLKEKVCESAEKSQERTKMPQQLLDPETGSLMKIKPKQTTKYRKTGGPQPERFPKSINCAIRCTFKCHQNFSEEERKQICDSFWSLDFKRRKDFILSRIETKDVEFPITPAYRKTDRPTRPYHTKFYLPSVLNSESIRVCKHFMMKTLCIDRRFIQNAIQFADKTTGFYTGVDRRTCSHPPTNKISEDRRQVVLDHINSYPCWLPNKKSKTKYLHCTLSIMKMYTEYKDLCLAKREKYVSTRYYYKTFHEDFRLAFLSNPQQKIGVFRVLNPNISHYTGNEIGGCWIDDKGNELDLQLINPAQSLNISEDQYIVEYLEESSNSLDN